MSMRRQITIGLGVAACVAVVAATAAWTAYRPKGAESLAERLPADAVLAYARIPAGAPAPVGMFGAFASSLPLPEVEPGVTELAAVRAADGAEGWIGFAIVEGRARIHGSNPALAPLLSEPLGAPLSSDPTFRALSRGAGDAYLYVAYPRLPTADFPFAAMLAADAPVLVSGGEGRLSVRVPLASAPLFAPRTGRNLAKVPNADVTLEIPAWDDAAEAGSTLTENARLVAGAMADSFANRVGQVSLRYEVAPLLHEPSRLQAGTGSGGAKIFALEGTGRSPAETDAALRTLHERFASARGGARVKVSEAEGFTMRTMTVDSPGATAERTEGEWTILETSAGGERLVSARSGRDFAVTNAPETLSPPAERTEPGDGRSRVAWETAAPLLAPLLPWARPDGADLGLKLSSGPGYLEWTVDGIRGL